MNRVLLFFILSVFSGLIIACSAQPVNQSIDKATGERVAVAGGSYTNITVDELKAMLMDKDFIFVNTHIPFEGDIPDTDLSIAFDQIDENLDRLPADLDAKIVLYCRSDRMSTIAAERLVELGYTNVWNLIGGMVAWEKADFPLEGK